jgi:formylglycine-generating enzyme required for sulfatase activity
MLFLSASSRGLLGVRICLLAFFLGLPFMLWSQDVEDLKKGIVKISATVEGKTKVGTGFIVRLEKGTAYIVTAAHVIEGDPKPQVAFHPRANEFLSSQTLGIEGGDPRGVAVLVVKGNVPLEARAFSISTKAAVRGGESVTVIGFPGQTGTPWMVTTGTVGGRTGSDLTFSGVVGEGNSGGPLLLGGKVIGVITQMGSKVSYAIPISSARFAIEGWGVRLTESDEALLPKEITGKDGITMVLVPAGEFLMGAEKQHVYLDAFYVDKELTKERGWHKAEEYCRSNGKRLPFEAEWEKAARRQLIASGKVYEWTADWYQRDYPGIRELRNPHGPPSGESNDEALIRYDDKARSDAEKWADYVCSHASSGCSAFQRSVTLKNALDAKRAARPPRDMMKVVRKELNSRSGVFSRYEGLDFRCVRDAK